MIRRYTNFAFIYAIVAMVCGVFYREFTKILDFTGQTNLSRMHTHYFLLGMFFFLILALLEHSMNFSKFANTGRAVLIYNIGLNISGVGLFARGLVDVLNPTPSAALSASISGISGIGHILFGVGLILLLLRVKKRVATPEHSRN